MRLDLRKLSIPSDKGRNVTFKKSSNFRHTERSLRIPASELILQQPFACRTREIVCKSQIFQ